MSYNEGEARVLSANSVRYHDDIYILTCERYRGYYTVARRYEFYVRVARTILFLPREHKIHIFEPTCNVLFIIWRLNIEYFRFYCVVLSSQDLQIRLGFIKKGGKKKAGIVTSLNDTTLAKVTYGKYATRVPDEVAYGIYEWFSSQ